jgi:hypothetical protein
MNYEGLVEKYVALRDKKDEITKVYKKDVAVIDTVMEKVEAALLAHLDETGVESIRTKAGTAFKTTRVSATVGDWDALFAYIMQTENYQFIEHRVSKAAVVEFKDANNDLPPGVNWREEVVVQIRRG